MTDREKPHFSRRVLLLAERAQLSIGHTAVGTALGDLIKGSDSPGAVRGDWHSVGVHVDIPATLRVPGDPTAGRLASNWRRAMVMATPIDAISDLFDKIGETSFRYAVAYLADDVAHIGVKERNGFLTFGRINANERAVAMRLGRGPLEATMGLWLPEERAFMGVESLREVETDVPVMAIGAERGRYPNLSLLT